MNKDKEYKNLINEVPDFPKDGVSFKDISPLLAHKNMFRLALFDMLQGHNNDLWAGVDSRGFLFASGLSQINGGGILMIRKKGQSLLKSTSVKNRRRNSMMIIYRS